MFLKDPLYTLRTGVSLFREFGFARDVGITVFRVVGGFILAAIVAVPLGILMGAYKPVEALLEPFVSFARYLPASAFIPLLILWAGVGEKQKLAVIFIGSVFQIILMVAVIVGSTRRDLIEAAQSLGISAGQKLFYLIDAFLKLDAGGGFGGASQRDEESEKQEGLQALHITPLV